MKAKVKAIDFFPKAFFWEYHSEEIFFEDCPNLIIERVLDRTPDTGIASAINILERFYNKEDILKIATSSQQIFGNENIEAIANYYNINPQVFPRYIC